MKQTYSNALIVGAGPGLSASLARLFVGEGIATCLASRNTDKLKPLCQSVGATAIACDASDPAQVENLFEQLDSAGTTPDLVVYNPSYRIRGPFVELDPEGVRKSLEITAYGAFLVAQQAVKRMLPNNKGCVLLTGASAGVKGYPQSAPFAMGKFALRGMAQSMARELHPQGIHVAHFVIDGGIAAPGPRDPERGADSADDMLHPDAIAQSYMEIAQQDRSVWSWEIEVRPWVERF